MKVMVSSAFMAAKKAIVKATAIGCLSLVWLHTAVYAQQQNPEDFVGYWKDAGGEGVMRTYLCRSSKFATEKDALCARVVWDNDATDKVSNRRAFEDCNRQIMFLKKFNDGVWEDGWVYDVRDHKTWRAIVRMSKDGRTGYLRLFVGNERNGKTEIVTRVDSAPPGCAGLRPKKVVF